MGWEVRVHEAQGGVEQIEVDCHGTLVTLEGVSGGEGGEGEGRREGEREGERESNVLISWTS